MRASPAPSQSGEAADPPGCRLGHKGKFTRNGRRWSYAAAPPTVPPETAAASPMPHKGQMAPKAAPISPVISPSSPLPSVVLAHVHPPSKSEPDKDHSNTMLPDSPLSSAAGLLTVQWAILLPLALVLQL
uniref:Uncharacterized protein n=1 Tax=Rhizophora mucronata TaxID=61149 RepID=A0A2P2IH00_RHIMU